MDEEPLPFHTVTNIDFGVTKDSSLTVMCNGARFHITIHPENLRGVSKARNPEDDSSLESQYLQLLDGLQDPEDSTGSNAELFEDWVLEPCIPHFKELASARRHSRPMTLEEYFDPVAFVLTLVNGNDHLRAARRPHDPILTAHLAPKISPSDLQVHMKVPRVKASNVEILPGPHPLSDVTSDPPTKVRIQGGAQFFFKAASERDSFLRELDMLCRINSTGLPSKLHVPRLHHVVESSDGSSVIGMLLNYIAHDGHTLRTALPRSSIRDVVDQLHGVGAVWGDVKPDNVLIDEQGDAWVVDFGGGYSPDWVDREKRDSLSGDVQGISRLEEFLSVE